MEYLTFCHLRKVATKRTFARDEEEKEGEEEVEEKEEEKELQH